MKFTYLEQPPNKWTFEPPKVKRWVESRCKGKVLNLFAGKTRLMVKEFRVDVSKEFNPDFCGDAFEFVKTTDLKFDTIILDPPYNLRKSREKYQGRYIGSFTKIKKELVRILNPGGRVITFGYNSNGMGRGFEKTEICLINCKGDHQDIIVTVEDKTSDLRQNTIKKKVDG